MPAEWTNMTGDIRYSIDLLVFAWGGDVKKTQFASLRLKLHQQMLWRVSPAHHDFVRCSLHKLFRRQEKQLGDVDGLLDSGLGRHRILMLKEISFNVEVSHDSYRNHPNRID